MLECGGTRSPCPRATSTVDCTALHTLHAVLRNEGASRGALSGFPRLTLSHRQPSHHPRSANTSWNSR
eukprot:1156043-Pleurochrysis_carterae.AAC.1